MKKIFVLILSFLVFALLFTACSDIARITLPQNSSSPEIARGTITWTGQGMDSLALECGEEGYIHWVLNQAKDVTEAVLYLGGSELESYDDEPTVTPGGVYHFYTPYYDLETIEAYIGFDGELGKNSQFVIQEYCLGNSGGDPTYTVTFSVKTGSGTGDLTAKVDDVTISSGALVEEGKDVVFTASPDADYQVKDWFENDVSQTQTNTTYTVTNLQAPVEVQVEFETIPVITQYTLILSAGTGGLVNSVSGDYDEGTVVGIEATPDTGYQFANWTVSLGAAANVANTGVASTTVTMNEDMTITANFEEFTPPTYTAEEYFIFDSTTGTITGYDTTGGLDVLIPPTIDGIPVEHIADWAFLNLPLTSVIIPYGVTSIGNYAFYDNSLTLVEIPNSVTGIGYMAFDRNLLTSVDIPNSVISLGYQSFNRNQLTSIDIPDYLTFIGSYTFGNNLLTTVTIPDMVTTIDTNAFANNQLTSVIIGSGVMTINEWAFDGNYITSITIGAGVNIVQTNDSTNTMGEYLYFKKFYDDGGKLAGTYNYTDTYPEWWVKE